MDEIELIEKYLSPLTKKFKEALSLEDDAAILEKNNRNNVISVDNFIHGVHCPLELSPDLSVYRAVIIAASDLAAMASKPYCMFISISLTNSCSIDDIKKIVRGIKRSIKHTNLKLLGGDLCTYKGPLSFCITVVGNSKRKTLLKRKGAKNGDYLVVTGTIGDAKLGLDCLKKKNKTFSELDKKKVIKKFLVPPIRHELALAFSPYVKSCIDISDGLAIDAGKLAKYSNCGLNIISSKTPLSNITKNALRNNYYSIEQILSAGDDYELAFAVEKKNLDKIYKIAEIKKIKLTVMGNFIKKKGTYLNNKEFSKGYSHLK